MEKEEELELLKEFAKEAMPVCLKRQIDLQTVDKSGFVSEERIAEATAEDAFHTARAMLDQYIQYKSMLDEA